MPISKRINNLHIRSGTVLNSDDEDQEENSAKSPQGSSSSCEEHPSDPRFLPVNNSFHNLGMQVSTATSVGHHTSDMECVASPSMSTMYHNGPQHPLFHNGDLQHASNGLNGTANNNGLCEMNHNMQHWTNAQMYQEPISYEPDLDESQNPYYYHVNEMLYDLHVARMQRITKGPGQLHLG